MQIDTTKSRATGDKASARKELKQGASIAKVADLEVNEELAKQPLIDDEEEKQRERKFKNDHVEYLRVARKPLQFGIEEALTYNQHQHLNIQGVLQNFNNK